MIAMKKQIAIVLTALCLTAAAGFPAAADEGNVVEDGQERVVRVVERDKAEVKNALKVLCAPSGIVAAADGSILVTDTYNKQLWCIKNGETTLYAGTTGVRDIYGEPVGGYNDGNNSESLFKLPWAVAQFKDGYAVSDTENNAIRIVGTNITQTNTGHKLSGYKDGNSYLAVFNRPTGLAFNGKDILYVADTGNGAIRMVTTYGMVATLMTDLSEPTGLCYKNGSLYVAESGANRVLKITDGVVKEVYGSGTEGNADGPQAEAQLSCPQGVTVADDGAVYISDTGNGVVKKVVNGTVTTLFSSNPSVLESSLVSPLGLLVVGDQLYVCDNFSKKILILNR